MVRKKLAFFTVALNEDNAKYAQMMIKTFKRFHPDEEMILCDKGAFDKLGAKMEGPDNDMMRLTPLFAKELLKEYETVVRLDADQLILGNLNHIINSTCDVGTVLNINRVDPAQYGFVQFQGIAPNEYYNCGLVLMRGEQGRRFCDNWWRLCKSKYYDRLQYREQDLLNILAHFGDYNVQCFDHSDEPKKYFAWHGLVAKGEGMRMKVVGTWPKSKVILEPDKGNYPDHTTTIKAFHWAGGGGEKKMNYRVMFCDQVIDYIEFLLSDKEIYESK
jgi:hypothetical protein